MNSKKLMIAFIAVSIAALIVSSFAVFAVARTYSTSLMRDESDSLAEEITPPQISVSAPAESTSLDALSTPPSETEAAETSDTHETTAEIDEAESTAAETTISLTEPAFFRLTLSGERLVILSPEGEEVYERIVDQYGFHPKDREALSSGIDFSELEEAMSAVYDLIS